MAQQAAAEAVRQAAVERQRQVAARREEASPDEKLFWDSIKDSRHPAEYRTYLSQYPDGVFVDLVEDRLRVLVWDPIKDSTDPAPFETYLSEHPNGVFAQMARSRLEAVIEQSNAAVLKEYLSAYPQGEFSALAQTYLEVAIWDSIKASGDPAQYASYLAAYPQGKFAALALTRLESHEEAFWDFLQASGDPAQYASYLAIFPQGKFAALAQIRSMEFVWIEPGVFRMGLPLRRRDRGSDEGPEHEVELSQGFWLSKYEVTQGQWEAVMGTRPWSGQKYVQDHPSHPAVYISWNDVQEFIGRLNASVGDSLYRLPSEAEWEYACRAGSKTRWSFGDDEQQLTHYAWYSENAADVDEYYAHAVGTKRPNPWGLHDMHGNVWEWVQDGYDEDYYKRSPRVDPPGPTASSNRIVRGGSFARDAQRIRGTFRGRALPSYRNVDTGVRLLRIR